MKITKIIAFAAAFMLLATLTLSGNIEGNAADQSVIDYSRETDASLRMKPLKDRLAALTQADIDIETAKYRDIQVHWSKPLVSKLSTTEIIKGYLDGTFKPENPVTVAEFVTMTVKALGYKLELNSTYWAKNFIDKAVEDGLFNKGEFSDYNRAITREEVARIAVNAAMKYDTAPTHEMDNVVIVRLKDYKTIKDSNKQKVIDANLLGLMSVYGSSGKFMPQNKLTRAEAATVILRLLDNSARVKFEPKESEMIKITDTRDGEVRYIVNNNKAEVLPMTYKILEAAKLTKGFAAVAGALDSSSIGLHLWDNEDNMRNNTFGWDIDLRIQLTPITKNDMDWPYTMVIRNVQKTRDLHMDFIKALIREFYGIDSDKVIAHLNKCLNSAIKGDDTLYTIWTYTDGIKYNNRGILIKRYANDPAVTIWFYSK